MTNFTKNIIAVDADEIIAGFLDHFIAYYNGKFQTKVLKSQISSFKLDPLFNTSEEIFLQRIDEYYQEGEVLKIEPIKGSFEGINKLLKKGYQLEIITARPSTYRDATVEWVTKHFPKKFDQIHFAFNPYNKDSEPVTKAQICKKIGARVLIDDNIDNALDCAKNGIKVLLMDAPWNQVEDLPKGIIRVKSWKEIVKLI